MVLFHSPSVLHHNNQEEEAITLGSCMQPAAMETGQPWEYSLRKYLLLLATIVASVTYTVGFNPPGGVWQQGSNHGHDQKAGDPIIRHNHYHRHLTFFYCNATAFAASLVVIVLILLLAVLYDREKSVLQDREKDKKGVICIASGVVALRLVMVLDLLSLVGAYAAGTCRDKVTSLYSAALLASVFIYIALLKLLDWCFPDNNSGSMILSNSGSGGLPEVEEEEGLKKKMKAQERIRKVLMLLATFAVSITYVAGLSTPGGFWDSTEGSHRPGDAILKDHHSMRLTVFLLCNTTAFVASLLTTMLLIIDGRKLRKKRARSLELYICIVVALVSLVAAYAAGSCRNRATTVYVVSLVGAVLVFILLLGFFCTPCSNPEQRTDENQQTRDDASIQSVQPTSSTGTEALHKTRSLVLLLATLAATITYSAGLDPPGGLWQDNNGHIAGNPILLTLDARRYNGFFYCNSVAFVASLVVIILVQKELPVKHHVLEAAMILDLIGLMGAYAVGSCRNMKNSIYAMALAGAVLGYVVIHVIIFTLDHKANNYGSEDRLLEKRRKRLLLFAILAATITYQAGLTPPGGFLLQDSLKHHAGQPVLFYNDQRRYKIFFYCNSVSFMLSIALMILLVNPTVYRPAIRSNALSVCTAVGLSCLIGAYAAGSTQDIKTSIYISVLALVLFVAVGLLVVVLVRERNRNANPAAGRSIQQDAAKKEEERKKEEEEKKKGEKERKKHARHKYLMLVGILVASVAYQAGLEPPGGTWQSSSDGHEAGNPTMHDNMRGRYLVFFYSNSISFVASIVVIIMLLPHWLLLKKKDDCEEWPLRCEEWLLKVMNKAMVLGLVALLVAYAAGSTRGWKTSIYVALLIVAVLGYFAIHMKLSLRRQSTPHGYEKHIIQGNRPV